MRAIRASVLFLVFVIALTLGSRAEALETAAREAILLDADTGAILFAKEADTPMPPASMSKIMTVFIVFERLKEGRLSLDDLLPISEKAWRKGGSKMFVEVGDKVRVEDLLRGVIVQSGNDASIALAEGLAGSEEAFAGEMNAAAKRIGLTNSHFANATGWPDPEQQMTAHDLALLAEQIITHYPEYYHYFSELEFVWSDIHQSNRNPLLYKNIGADGLKTGHTEEAGYGLTGSASRDGRRLILVVAGLKSAAQRSEEAERLIEWGFREFDNYTLAKAGESLAEAPVWLGDAAAVPLVVQDDLVATLPRAARRDMKVSVVYDSPVPAPIAVGQPIATLRVTAPGRDPIEAPLVAGAAVEKLGPVRRVFAAMKYLVLGQP
jgi:D-alanyl-D-alanine carboxypeptidase (penicillin-binding protein 5/6)